MMPTPPLRLRNRLAETILRALGDPTARRELEHVAMIDNVDWLADAQPEHAAIVRARARRASQALATCPLLRLEPSPAACRSISRSAPALPGRDERWGVWGAMSGPPMSLVQALVAAAVLFDAGLHFEVHELLEPHWVRAQGAERQALQGLIQIAVGFQHLANGNLKGARSLLAEGPVRLRDGRLAGLDLDRFADAVSGAVNRMGGPEMAPHTPQRSEAPRQSRGAPRQCVSVPPFPRTT